MNKGFVGIILALLLLGLFMPCLCECSDIDLEKDLQRDLRQSKTIIEQLSGKLKTGGLITDELSRLKTLSENIKASHLLLQERFRLREEEIKVIGSKARERHGALSEGPGGLSESH